jgi:hypothetical protein
MTVQNEVVNRAVGVLECLIDTHRNIFFKIFCPTLAHGRSRWITLIRKAPSPFSAAMPAGVRADI